MTPRPYPSLITLFPWGNVFRVSHDYSSKEVLANKPICKSGTVCLPALAVLLLVPLDLTCVLMSNSWVAHGNYCSFEATAGVSNE